MSWPVLLCCWVLLWWCQRDHNITIPIQHSNYSQLRLSKITEKIIKTPCIICSKYLPTFLSPCFDIWNLLFLMKTCCIRPLQGSAINNIWEMKFTCLNLLVLWHVIDGAKFYLAETEDKAPERVSKSKFVRKHLNRQHSDHHLGNDTSCVTDGGPAQGEPCRFPFKHEGEWVDKCIPMTNGTDRLWCSTA